MTTIDRPLDDQESSTMDLPPAVARPGHSDNQSSVQDFYFSPGRCSLTERGNWWAESLEDHARYRAHHDGSRIKPLLLEQGLWALLQYRWASGVHRSDVVIAANSLVTRDVPSSCTAVGVPAGVVDTKGTAGMGLHQRRA